jgi:hypothetical protein
MNASLQVRLLLELLAERVVRVSLLALGIVESVAVVGVEVDALLQPEDKVGCGDEVTTEDDNDVAVLEVLVDELAGGFSLEATGDKQRAGSVQRVQWLQGVVALNVSVAGDPRLDHMQVGEVQVVELLNDIGELRNGVLHLHALEL